MIQRVKREKGEKREGGYVAIITTIMISLVLLAMIAENGFLGWHARFVALNREKKHQADALVRGCTELALAALIKDSSATSSTLVIPLGICDAEVVDASDPEALEIHVQSRVGSADAGGVAYANLQIIANVHDGQIGQIEETANQ